MVERREPRVVQVVREFKQQILLQEAAQMQQMARRWLEIEEALEAEIYNLALQMDELRRQGQQPTLTQVYRLRRYRRLMAQAEAQFNRYADWAAREITRRQEQLALQGIDHARQAIQAAFYPQVGAYFDRLPVDAVEMMFGLAGDGAPIGDLLYNRMVRAGGQPIPGVHDRLVQDLIQGTALGWNPRKTARAMQDDLAGGLQKALVIARSEQLRVYRFSNQQQYESSGVVRVHMRVSAHDFRVCPACIAADGEIYPLGKPIDDHPSGRCTSVPVIKDQEPPQWLSGEAWFRAQDPEVQRSILGPERLAAWRDGRFGFSQLITRTDDPTWGTGLVATPLKDLVEAG